MWADFSDDEVESRKRLVSLPFAAPGGGGTYTVLEARVEGRTSTALALPERLSTPGWHDAADAVNENSPRRILMAMGHGMGWTLNGRSFEMEAVADDEMSVWESRLAAAAAAVILRRQASCSALAAAFDPIYDRLRGEDFPAVELSYRGEAGVGPAENTPEVEEYYQKRYNETRTRDRRNGFTGDGPHRHDLGLKADGRTLRHTLSSGQTKVVAAALRLAGLKQVERQRGERLPVIIDDIDAELDGVVLSRLLEYVSGDRQVFLSSADDRVHRKLRHGSGRIEVRQGAIIGAAGERTDERRVHS